MTKKRRRPINLHVMVSEEEQALIRERMAEALGYAGRELSAVNEAAGALCRELGELTGRTALFL